jgi:hypothetical protein
MRSASSLSLAVQAAAQIDALVAFSRDAKAPTSYAQHAELLARALALVSRRHVTSAPTRARATTLAGLEELRTALQQHETFAVAPEATADALQATQQQLLEGGLLALWANVTTYELLVALADLIVAVDFIPHALRFWKNLRRRPVRAIVQGGPFEWMQPEYVLRGQGGHTNHQWTNVSLVWIFLQQRAHHDRRAYLQPRKHAQHCAGGSWFLIC